MTHTVGAHVGKASKIKRDKYKAIQENPTLAICLLETETAWGGHFLLLPLHSKHTVQVGIMWG